MVEKTVLDQQQESVEVQYLVPLIVNGANGELGALHAVMGFRKESLSNKHNMEENNVIFFK